MADARQKPILIGHSFNDNGDRIVSLQGAFFRMKEGPGNVDYYICLGAMLHQFSLMEQSLAWMLSVIANTNTEVIGPIVYPLRIDSGVSMMRRLVRSKNITGKRINEVLQSLDHLLLINKARNDILHLGASIKVGRETFEVTNALSSFHKSALKSTLFKNVDLVRMEYDLYLISAIWIDYSRYRGRSKVLKDKTAEAAENLTRTIRKNIPLGAPIPWLYIPPKPKDAARRTRKKRRKPTPPPPPSQA